MSRHDSRPSVLALRALGLGDLLTAVPALRALRDGFPEHRVVLATPAVLKPVLDLVGGIDLVDAAGLAPLRIRDCIDVAVNLHGRGPESHARLLALAPRRLVAFAHPTVPETSGAPEWREEHEVHRWCRLLEESGIEANPQDLDLDLRTSGARMERAPSYVVVHPGAAAQARRWPADRFAAVVRAERARSGAVLLTGNAAERPRALHIAALAGLEVESVLAGHTDVAQLIDTVAGAELVVSGDTGVAHLAVALGRPSVVLFGPTSPDDWGPPRERPWHRALWAGRLGDPHGRVVDGGLLEISVQEVLDSMDLVRAVAPARAAAGGRRDFTPTRA